MVGGAIRLWAVATVTSLLAAAIASGAVAQTLELGPADVADREAQIEEMWARLPDPKEVHPKEILAFWGVLIQAEVVLEKTRLVVAGIAENPDGEAITRRALERLRRLRPEDPGPDLFPLFQIQDQREQTRAIVALLDRYPDDLLVVWQATQRLRYGGDVQRATEILEALRDRQPDRPMVFELLSSHYSSLQNDTLQAEALAAWADLAPADPSMVTHWLASSLPRIEPDATSRVLDRFFTASPTGPAALQACIRVARSREASHHEMAHSCIARLAADPASDDSVAERAQSALIEITARSDDASMLRAALRGLAPQARFGATMAAIGHLEAPARCLMRIELLAELLDLTPWPGGFPGGAARALQPCSERPEAEAPFLELVRRAEADGVLSAVRVWANRVNNRWQGDLPRSVVPVLESRHAQEPDAGDLFAALDIAYQLADAEKRRLELLRRWQDEAPSSFRGEQAIALAAELWASGDPEGARRTLEGQLERRFERSVAEELWELYLFDTDPQRAERFAAGLLADADGYRVATGNLLAARSAILQQELAEAERQYWSHLREGTPTAEVAAELIALILDQGDESRATETARRICEETPIPARGGPARCAADLLGRAGNHAAQAKVLADRGDELPEDIESLEELASVAGSGGQLDIAERAYRRMLELDSLDPRVWEGLAGFLAKQGRVDELEELLSSARDAFSPPPSGVLKAVARACLAAGRTRRAIDLFREARDSLPPGYDPAWINDELRKAYEQLGRSGG